MSLSAPSFQISHFLPLPSKTDSSVWVYKTYRIDLNHLERDIQSDQSDSPPFLEWLSSKPKNSTIKIVARYDWDVRACELLDHAKHAVKLGYSVCIFTGSGGTCAEAPCGCTGYDEPCEYHRDGGRCEDLVAGCFCSKKYGTTCDYHQYGLCVGCSYCDGSDYAVQTQKETPDAE